MRTLRNLVPRLFVISLLVLSQALSAAPPSVDLWTAAATGNVGALKKHQAAGTNLNAADTNGSSALNA
ncbi:MAG: hypothetical protein VX266_07470, partial [Pseudomonadota bacterium]|nr:hypothetical protein [Pseudomonadota bacterium]